MECRCYGAVLRDRNNTRRGRWYRKLYIDFPGHGTTTTETEAATKKAADGVGTEAAMEEGLATDLYEQNQFLLPVEDIVGNEIEVQSEEMSREDSDQIRIVTRVMSAAQLEETLMHHEIQDYHEEFVKDVSGEEEEMDDSVRILVQTRELKECLEFNSSQDDDPLQGRITSTSSIDTLREEEMTEQLRKKAKAGPDLEKSSHSVVRTRTWTSEMIQKLLDGVNSLGIGHWEAIKSAYRFPKSMTGPKLCSKWQHLVGKNLVTFVESKWILTCEIVVKDMDASSSNDSSLTQWTQAMVENLVEGVNATGTNHWEAIRKLYEFPATMPICSLAQKWECLLQDNHIKFENDKWILLKRDNIPSS